MTAMNGEDPFVPALASALRARGAQASVVLTGPCPYIPLPATWDGYLRALASPSRYLLTKALRELDRWAGSDGWELRSAQTREELSEGMRILRELHAQRWKAAGQRGVFDESERFRRFHETVAPRLLAGEDGTGVDLSWLMVRGQAVAASYCLVYGGRTCFYQSGRRVDVPKSVRPGIALHGLCIRANIEAGRREYDFLAGASRYKRELALANRSLATLRAIAPGLRARAVDAACELAERAIARVRTIRPSVVSARPGSATE
jgi:CelD/BcsL family acetyltransferase involved in cellulose biosynthesis